VFHSALTRDGVEVAVALFYSGNDFEPVVFERGLIDGWDTPNSSAARRTLPFRATIQK